MMKDNIVKNRYLELDGTPSESGIWRKYISPWTLTSAFVGAMAACVVADDETPYTPTVIFSLSAAGLASKGWARSRLTKTLQTESQKYVIDTAPEIKKHYCSDAEKERILHSTKLNANAGMIVNLGIGTYLCATQPLLHAFVLEAALAPVPVAYSYEGYYLANKIEKNEWTIIPRGETEKLPTPLLKPAHS